MSYTIGHNPRVRSLPAMPKCFTIPQLQQAFERVLGHPLDKRNFRKQLRLFRLIRPLGTSVRTGTKPAQVYAYTREARRKRLVIL